MSGIQVPIGQEALIQAESLATEIDSWAQIKKKGTGCAAALKHAIAVDTS